MKNRSTKKRKTEFGGSLLQGRRRARRPLDHKVPTHLVLKADRSDILLLNQRTIRETLHYFGQRFGVRVYECGVHADHIHLAIKTPSRILYVRWIRSVTSVLVQKMSGLTWKFRPYTRLAKWGRPYLILKKYIQENQRVGDILLAAHRKYERYKANLLRIFVILHPPPDPSP